MKIDLKEIRLKWHKENNSICPILKTQYPVEKMCIDHDHSTGFIRGCIHLQANSLEGKILGAYKRTGVSKLIDLPSFLRNLADYLENNMSNLELVHPTAMPKTPKLSLNSYNKLSKVCTSKMPKYTGKLTKVLTKLFEKYKIEPTFNKV